MEGTGVVQERRKGNVDQTLWCACAGSSIEAWGADSALLLRSECSDGCGYMQSLYLIGKYLEVTRVEGTRAFAASTTVIHLSCLYNPSDNQTSWWCSSQKRLHKAVGSSFICGEAVLDLKKHIYSLVIGNFFKDILFALCQSFNFWLVYALAAGEEVLCNKLGTQKTTPWEGALWVVIKILIKNSH